MMLCPLCDFENIDGVDSCEQCGQPFSDSHLQSPKSAVERGLLVDRVGSLTSQALIAVPAPTRIRDVLKLLVDRQIGCVFVIQGDSIVGVFSERDALLRLNTQVSGFMDEPVSRFMTPNPQSLPETARLAYAVHLMDLGGYRHLPLVDEEGRAAGVISVRDILRYLTQKLGR